MAHPFAVFAKGGIPCCPRRGCSCDARYLSLQEQGKSKSKDFCSWGFPPLEETQGWATRRMHPVPLAQGFFLEDEFHQMGRLVVELRLQIFVVAGESGPERGQIHRAFHLVHRVKCGVA